MKEYIKKIKDFVAKNSTYLIIVFVCLVMVIVSLVLLSKGKNEESGIEISQIVTEELKDEVKNIPLKKSIIPQKKDIKLSYVKALEKYKDSRMQFGEKHCNSTPIKMVVKNGTDIMLDNRSKETRIIGFMNQKISIAPYDYEVVNVFSNKLPESILLDCGAQQNVSEIYIER